MANKRRGFSLLELLVVTGLTASALLVAVPSLSSKREQARSAICQSYLKQWGVVFSIYANENHGFNHNFWPSLKLNDGWDTYLKRLAVEYYKPIYEDPNLLMCPAASTSMSRGGPRASWVTWTGGGMTGLTGSYGENLWTTNPAIDMGGGFSSIYFWKRMGVAGSDQVPLFMDSVCPYMFPNSSDAPPLTPDGQFTGGVNPIKYPCVDRHGNGTINVLFLDGNVRKVGLKELWTLKWSTHFRIDNRYTSAGGVTPDSWPTWMQGFKDY
jgi:prepilin-type processing-associated H-X9-DG protein/prepilin-type N-terminal cleavage/methylation domain-containing protein